MPAGVGVHRKLAVAKAARGSAQDARSLRSCSEVALRRGNPSAMPLFRAPTDASTASTTSITSSSVARAGGAGSGPEARRGRGRRQLVLPAGGLRSGGPGGGAALGQSVLQIRYLDQSKSPSATVSQEPSSACQRQGRMRGMISARKVKYGICLWKS